MNFPSKKIVKYLAFAAFVIIPLSLWGSWDFITGPQQLWLRIILGIVVVIAVYVSLFLLLWWNSFMQNYWKNKKNKHNER